MPTTNTFIFSHPGKTAHYGRRRVSFKGVSVNNSNYVWDLLSTGAVPVLVTWGNKGLSIDQIIILAIIQGLAEFLPISSSGHLVVADALLQAIGRTPPAKLIEVSIVLHLGTLGSVIYFYWNRIWRLFGADRRVIWLMIVGTLPAVVFGLLLKSLVPQVLERPLVAGLLFPVTGLLLIGASRKQPGTLDYLQLSYRQAFFIGLLQAVAILPGISRSGCTIIAGLAVGMRRSSAATFAFLLAIPAILGAGVLEALDMVQTGGSSTQPGMLVVGFFVSFVVGIVSLWWLIRLLESGRLYFFAWWLIPLGIGVTAWQLWT